MTDCFDVRLLTPSLETSEASVRSEVSEVRTRLTLLTLLQVSDVVSEIIYDPPAVIPDKTLTPDHRNRKDYPACPPTPPCSCPTPTKPT